MCEFELAGINLSWLVSRLTWFNPEPEVTRALVPGVCLQDFANHQALKNW